MKSLKARRLILRLAYARCEHDRGAAAGPCSECFRIELERHVARANPGLVREDVVRRVENSVLSASRLRPDVPLAS